MSTVNVVATIKAKVGKEKDLLDVLEKMVDETHLEPGCVTYALHRSQADPGTFIFIEKWASEHDLQNHFQTPHVQQAMRRKEELIQALDIAPLIPLPRGSSKKNVF